MKTVSDGELIFEEHEVCAVCGGTANLSVFDDQITVCGACYSGGRFQEWLEVEIEKAVEASPDFERLPSGGFRRIKPLNRSSRISSNWRVRNGRDYKTK